MQHTRTHHIVVGRPASGYTILELLVTLAIVALLAAATVPSLQDIVTRNARDSGMQDLMTAIAGTRSEAVTRAASVALCRSVDASACAASTNGDWKDGWLVFQDAGTAGVVDGSDQIVLVHPALNGQNAIRIRTGSGANISGDYLRFSPEGFLQDPDNGAYFKFCDAANAPGNARAIWVGNAGRAALSVDDADGIHNDMAGVDLVCP
ncbi:MAG: GspH/FimT family pseudopilin [Pseudomonadales bacterium]|nr:GspH/FimT family pseudopilin [Pseudomonadales bacterium]